MFADIDRVKAEKLGVAPEKVFEALQVYLGSAYINDFNYLGRTYQVVAQADGRFRTTIGGHRPAEDPQRGRRDGADRLRRELPQRDRSVPRAALRPVPGSGGPGRDLAGRVLRLRPVGDGAAGQGDPAGWHRLRVDRPCVPAAAGRKYGSW